MTQTRPLAVVTGAWDTGVTITSLMPGPTETNFFQVLPDKAKAQAQAHRKMAEPDA